MPVTLIEGFDLYNGVAANVGVQAKWTSTNTTNLSLVAGRFNSGQALQYSVGGGSATLNRTLPAPVAAFVANMALRFTALTGAAPSNAICPFIIFRNAATYMLGIKVNHLGRLEVYRMSATFAGTLLGTSTVCILLNTFHYLEAAFEISDTVGTVTLKVDGNIVLALTAQDTRNGTPTTVDIVQLGDAFNIAFDGPWVAQIDDFYMTDSSVFVGERRIETLYPSSDIAQGFARSTGAVNFALVDEPTVNGDVDFVQGSTVGNVDTYGFTDLSSLPVVIDAVQLSAFGLKTDAASRSIALQAKSGGTTSDGANFVLTASYTKMERFMLTDPNTAAAWTAAAINALQAGPKVTV